MIDPPTVMLILSAAATIAAVGIRAIHYVQRALAGRRREQWQIVMGRPPLILPQSMQIVRIPNSPDLQPDRIAELERTVLFPPISETIAEAEQRAVREWNRDHPATPPSRPRIDPPAAGVVLAELCDDCTWTTIYAGLGTIAVRRVLTKPCLVHEDLRRRRRPEPRLPDPGRPAEWR